jgi:hypothetical protein
VRARYILVPGHQPSPALGGSSYRSRPLLAVRLIGPGDSRLRDGILDTGADETIFEDSVAPLIGIDLSYAEERNVRLVGRAKAVRCRYAPVKMRITDRVETYEWTAVVGFAATRLRYQLLGHGGFLQFFDVTFRGDDRDVILTPNHSFPGTSP